MEGKPAVIDAILVWCLIGGKIKEAWDIPIVHTAKTMKIVDVATENAAKEAFFRIKDTKRRGFMDKDNWLEKCHKEGLKAISYYAYRNSQLQPKKNIRNYDGASHCLNALSYKTAVL